MATTLHSSLIGTELHYSKIQTAAGTPGTTPQYVGQSYFDNQNRILYIANDTSSSASWQAVVGIGGASTVIEESSTSFTVTVSNNTAVIAMENVAARTVTLLSSPINGFTVSIYDLAGTANTANILINASGSDKFYNTSGGTSYKITSNYGCTTFVYDYNSSVWIPEASFIGQQINVKSVSNILGSSLAIQTTDTNNLQLNVNYINALNISTTLFEVKKTVQFDDITDTTKQIAFDISNATTSAKTILNFQQTTGRIITFPDITDQLVTRNTTDILTNKSVNNLKFNNAGNTFYTNVIGGNNSSNLTLTLPITAPAIGQTLISSDTAGTLQWNNITVANANVAANDSNVTFLTTSNRFQNCFPTAPRTYTMPSTGLSSGDTWTFYNRSTGAAYANYITLVAPDNSVIGYCFEGGETTIQTNINNPSTFSDWNVISSLSTGGAFFGNIVNGSGIFSSGITNYSFLLSQNKNIVTLTGNVSNVAGSNTNIAAGGFVVPVTTTTSSTNISYCTINAAHTASVAGTGPSIVATASASTFDISDILNINVALSGNTSYLVLNFTYQYLLY